TAAGVASSIFTLGSATALTMVSVNSDTAAPGRSRQLIVAFTRCGWALDAWPPSIRVGMQVVPSIGPQDTFLLTTAAAAASDGSASRARMAAPSAGLTCEAMPVK